MTLVFRSQPFVLPERAAHMVQAAFHRTFKLPNTALAGQNCVSWGPRCAKGARRYLRKLCDCAQFFTSTKPNHLNYFTSEIIHWSICYIQRRATVIFDICERFLTVFGHPLARKRLSAALNIFSFAYKMMKKSTKETGGDKLTVDQREGNLLP